MRIASPCMDCGTPTREGVRCEECAAAHAKVQPARERVRPARAPKLSAHERGYDSRWTRLSRRARQAQPFCSDCGTTHDLQCDHLPSAWERKEKGLPVRLEDVDVVCGDCNRRRGAARGKSARRRSKTSNGARGHWAT